MTSPALNTREELDKAVIAAQKAFDLLSVNMSQLQHLQTHRHSVARISSAIQDAVVGTGRLRVRLEAASAATNPDLTFNAGKAEPWTVADEGIRQ